MQRHRSGKAPQKLNDLAKVVEWVHYRAGPGAQVSGHPGFRSTHLAKSRQ